jgi:hypothetical protein
MISLPFLSVNVRMQLGGLAVPLPDAVIMRTHLDLD